MDSLEDSSLAHSVTAVLALQNEYCDIVFTIFVKKKSRVSKSFHSVAKIMKEVMDKDMKISPILLIY